MDVEYKVIAIKLPFDLQERILTFPFLHLLREKFPEADLHFITPKYRIEVLNLLTFKAYYHEYEDGDFDNIFTAHRWCALSKIYNVDLFINLTNSFVDASLGLFLRAKNRLGFSDGWKTILLNMKCSRPQNWHLSEDYFELYKVLTKLNDVNVKVLGRDPGAIIKDWDSLPYIAINLSPMRKAGIEEEILDLINSFEGQRILLFASEDQEKFQLLVESFIARLSPKNTYVNFVYKDWIELSKMLTYARGVVTFNGPVASLSAYCGSKTVILFDSENIRRTGPLYFLGESKILDVNEPRWQLTQVSSSSSSLQERKRFDMNEVYGEAFEFFKLVIERPL